MLQQGRGDAASEISEQLGLVTLAGHGPAWSRSPAHIEIRISRVHSSKIWPDFQNPDLFNLRGEYQKLFSAFADQTFV